MSAIERTGGNILDKTEGVLEAGYHHFGIYDRTILSEETGYFEEYSDSQIKSAIRDHWEALCAHDLPQIRALIRQHILESDTHVS